MSKDTGKLVPRPLPRNGLIRISEAAVGQRYHPNGISFIKA